MRKLIYLIVTFCVCFLFGLGKIWLGFVVPFLAISFLKFDDSLVWEIPLAVLCCSVLEIAFSDDIKILLQILVLFSTFLISVISFRRLSLFFLIVVFAMLYENTYSLSAVWAMLWYGARSTLSYFITNKTSLQEYKS